jgi:TP901 family phage tail tape measure protein
VASEEEMNPTVTLDANVNPYVDSLDQAAVATERLSGAVDTLTQKAKTLRNQTATGLQIVGAGTLAGLSTMALVAANAQEQMDTLAASSKIAGKNFDYLRTQISAMSRDLPQSRAEITQLTTQLSKMGLASESQATTFARLFTKMGSATGENSSGLAAQLVQLNRQMGNMNTQSVDRFANSVTNVSAKLGVSATGLLDFSNSIAPFARAAGMGEQAVIGISAAFTKAGADGYSAANTFNQMQSEITTMIQNGSPELNKYAAVVGVTMDQFKNMDPAERFISVVEAIKKAGPDAGKVLTRLGFDGIRAAKALNTVAGNAGDLRKAVGLADVDGGAADQRSKYQDSGILSQVGGAISRNVPGPIRGMLASTGTAIDEGAKAADSGLIDQSRRLRNNTEDIAVTLGTPIMAPMSLATRALANFTGAIGSVLQVFRPFVSLLGVVGAGFLALGLAMKGSAIAAGINTLQYVMKGAGVSGFVSGFRGGRANDMNAGGTWAARYNLPQIGPLQEGQQRLDPLQRTVVGAGMGAGSMFRRAFGEADPKARNPFVRAFGTAAAGAGWLADASRQFYTEANYMGYDRKSQIVRPTAEFLTRGMRRGLEGVDAANPGEGVGRGGFLQASASAAWKDPKAFFRGFAGSGDIDKAAVQKIINDPQYGGNQAKIDAALKKYMLALEKKAAALIKGAAAENDAAAQVAGQFGRTTGKYARAQFANVRSAGAYAIEGVSALTGVLGRGAMQLAGGPIGLGVIGAIGAKTILERQKAESEQKAKEAAAYDPLQSYNEKLGRTGGLQTLAAYKATEVANRARRDKTPEEALALTSGEFDLAAGDSNKLQNEKLKGMSSAELLAFMRMNNQQFKDDPRVLSAVVSDIAKVTQSMAETQNILAQYRNRSEANTGDYEVASAQYGRAHSTAKGGAGWFTRNLNIGTSKGLDEIVSGQINVIEDTASKKEQSAGQDVGIASRAADYTKMIAGLPTVGRTSTDGARGGELGSGRMPKIMGFNNANYTNLWDQGARDVNASWKTFFQKLEDEYSPGGKRLGLSYGNMAKFAEGKYGDQAQEMFDSPATRAKVVSEYLRSGDVGAKGGNEVADQVFGKYAGKSITEIQGIVTKALENPAESADTTFGQQKAAATKYYGPAGGQVAKSMLSGEQYAKGLANEGDANIQFQTRNMMVEKAMKFADGDTNKANAFIQNMIQNVPNTYDYTIGSAASQEIQRQNEVQRNTMVSGIGLAVGADGQPMSLNSRTSKLANTVDAYNKAFAPNMTGQGAETAKQQAQINLDAAKTGVEDYFRNILMQQREFAVQSVRMEEQYNLQRSRAQAAFNLQMKQAEEDFNQQRKYQQEDFATSMKRMTEDMSKNIYNPYQRTDAKYTWSAEGSLFNVQEQTKDIENQTSNLKKLEGLGVDKQVIQQLGLADPANAQQLQRYVEELAANPSLVEAFNKALSARVDATSELLSSGYVDTYNRTVADFEKGVGRAESAFAKSQRRATAAFKLTMSQMAHDHGVAVRQAKEDIIRAQTEIGGNLGTMLDGATKALGTNLGKAGDELIAKLNEIRTKYPQLFPGYTPPSGGGGGGGGGGAEGGGTKGGYTMATTRYGNKSVKIVGGSYREGAGGDGWGYAKMYGTGDDVMVKTPTTVKNKAFGGSVRQNESYVVGEKGPEMLTGVSGHIMPSSSFQSSVAREVVQSMKVSGFDSPTTYKGAQSVSVDNSTQIHGGHWTIQTQDPDEMGRKLKDKERLRQLRSPKPSPVG